MTLSQTGSDQPFNPERRLTDSLIGANLVIYAMQVLSGQQLTLLGLKVPTAAPACRLDGPRQIQGCHGTCS